jgi:hypothetical protein
MSRFSQKELKNCMLFGTALFLTGALLWMGSWTAGRWERGVPEYRDFTRMLGLNLLTIGLLWTGIAGFLRLPASGGGYVAQENERIPEKNGKRKNK